MSPLPALLLLAALLVEALAGVESTPSDATSNFSPTRTLRGARVPLEPRPSEPGQYQVTEGLTCDLLTGEPILIDDSTGAEQPVPGRSPSKKGGSSGSGRPRVEGAEGSSPRGGPTLRATSEVLVLCFCGLCLLVVGTISVPGVFERRSDARACEHPDARRRRSQGHAFVDMFQSCGISQTIWYVCILVGVMRATSPGTCLLYTSPSPRDRQKSRMPSSA